MRKKIIIMALLVFANTISFSQTEKMLSNQNGFEIAYRAQKISGGKKDKWLITVTAVNKTQHAIFYEQPTAVQSPGSTAPNGFAYQSSSKVTVRNAIGFLANDGVMIKGEPTKLFTESKSTVLMQYEPGRIYNYESSVNIKPGDSPIVTVSHYYPLRKLSEFNIQISAELIDGDYKTTCGLNTWSVSMKEENGKSYLIQSVNGKQIKWIKSTATLFLKETDSSTIISYNREKKTFAYSNSDGVNCEWTKL
ncbi:MAG: hypothetical protein EAY75_16935 [Bacteroidetes bacterium]|nr:MAG: hypothetical protein EAY75_16935 [Bacteroidota bacterium]